jgi:ABC-type sugar transport system substrate-binding protein
MFHRVLGLAALIACVAGTTGAASAAAEGKRVAMFMGPTQDKYLGALSRRRAPASTA